jgi:hypothetical protein
MDYVEMYYNLAHGCYPFSNDDNKIKSQKVIDYLKECGIEPYQIFRFIETASSMDCLSPGMLPEWLWENSLLKKDKFYYHNSLHINSQVPSWDPLAKKEVIYDFYMEMKIKYTTEELLRYAYTTLKIDCVLIDEKRDKASLGYLLGKYQKFEFIEAIDVVLSLIDHAANQENRVRNLLDVSQYESEVYDMLLVKVAEAKLAKANKIVWR